MLDVHAPHETVHTWRDFFIHIATIVVGLCIAVGLEQAVEAVHHRHGMELELDHLAPHDLRRTCAKLCHVNGGELEQIQFLLGLASVLTMERYLGCKQNLEEPVNDRFGCLFSMSVDSRYGQLA